MEVLSIWKTQCTHAESMARFLYSGLLDEIEAENVISPENVDRSFSCEGIRTCNRRPSMEPLTFPYKHGLSIFHNDTLHQGRAAYTASTELVSRPSQEAVSEGCIFSPPPPRPQVLHL